MNSSVPGALCVLCMIIGLSACTQPDPPAPERPVATIELGEIIEWTPVDGAAEYRVQLWDGARLLFEELREQPALPVTPVMERSLLGVSRAELQVRARGKVSRINWMRGGSTDSEKSPNRSTQDTSSPLRRISQQDLVAVPWKHRDHARRDARVELETHRGGIGGPPGSR